MSLATRQSQSLLAFLEGLGLTIETYELADETLPTILYLISELKNASVLWPETGDWDKNTKWMVDRIHRMDDEIKKAEEKYSYLILISMSVQIINDLLQMISDKKKLDLLRPVVEAIVGVSNALDPKGNQFKAYKKAEDIVRGVYLELEFSVEYITMLQKKRKKRLQNA